MTALHHRDEGSGPVVLLLHAGVADSRMWDTQVEELVPGHRVVRCDLRGYGRTPLDAGASYSDAGDVLALLDELGVERCTVVAASYGGWVAQQVASAAPERVERLVLLATLGEVVAPDEELRSFWQAEDALMQGGDLDGATALNVATFLGPDAADDARHLLATMQRGILAHQSAAGDVENAELPVDLGRLTMPVTVVAGAHDLTFFVETARALAHALPAAELVELPWAGHLPSLERPLETAHLVRASLLD
jgi:pimeloyl-ACP methyl ester carboxylesterase